jgi:hypothetical protein
LRATIFGANAPDGVGGPVQVVIDDVSPVVVFHFENGYPPLDRGVRNDDVDLSIILLDAVCYLAQRRDVADVGLYALALAAERLDQAYCLVEFFLGGRDGVRSLPAMSTATTSAPFATISMAMARPIPLAAPVTTTTLSCSIVPRPGRIGPALRSAGASGTGFPSSSFGARSERTCAWAAPATANAPAAAAPLSTPRRSRSAIPFS